MYTNYFGLKDTFIKKLSKLSKNLIIDNSQSFFSLPKPNIPTFYSCRKFFGVPDGSYLYLSEIHEYDFPTDHSENRFAHLLKRIEFGAEEGYNDFKLNDIFLSEQPIKKMSNITKALLSNIDYKSVRKKRRRNYLFIHEKLSNFNKLNFTLKEESCPMVYPFLNNNSDNDLKKKLIDNKIFVATYWPNVLEMNKKESLEYYFASNIIYLPIDQRVTIEDLNYITKNI